MKSIPAQQYGLGSGQPHPFTTGIWQDIGSRIQRCGWQWRCPTAR
ncbi:MAG: hypothetical protein R2873_16270 [Caldilineaceae bacterium]